MEVQTSYWTDLILIPAAVMLLAVLHRLDLLTIVVPMSIVAGYAAEAVPRSHSSAEVKCR